MNEPHNITGEENYMRLRNSAELSEHLTYSLSENGFYDQRKT